MNDKKMDNEEVLRLWKTGGTKKSIAAEYRRRYTDKSNSQYGLELKMSAKQAMKEVEEIIYKDYMNNLSKGG